MLLRNDLAIVINYSQTRYIFLVQSQAMAGKKTELLRDYKVCAFRLTAYALYCPTYVCNWYNKHSIICQIIRILDSIPLCVVLFISIFFLVYIHIFIAIYTCFKIIKSSSTLVTYKILITENLVSPLFQLFRSNCNLRREIKKIERTKELEREREITRERKKETEGDRERERLSWLLSSFVPRLSRRTVRYCSVLQCNYSFE